MADKSPSFMGGREGSHPNPRSISLCDRPEGCGSGDLFVIVHRHEKPYADSLDKLPGPTHVVATHAVVNGEEGHIDRLHLALDIV